MGTSCREAQKISVRMRGGTRTSDFLRQAVSCMNRLAIDCWSALAVLAELAEERLAVDAECSGCLAVVLMMGL